MKAHAKSLGVVLTTLILLACRLPAWALTQEECRVACEVGSLQEVQYMLEQHSVDELFRVRDDGGRGLLHYCLRRGPEYWQALLDADWPVRKEKGWTPLHEAALLGADDAVVSLHEKGMPLSLKEPQNGGTPLHVASFNGHIKVVQYLVAKGAEVNARDKDGWTALSQARDQGFPKIVDWLKKNGAKR